MNESKMGTDHNEKPDYVGVGDQIETRYPGPHSSSDHTRAAERLGVTTLTSTLESPVDAGTGLDCHEYARKRFEGDDS